MNWEIDRSQFYKDRQAERREALISTIALIFVALVGIGELVHYHYVGQYL